MFQAAAAKHAVALLDRAVSNAKRMNAMNEMDGLPSNQVQCFFIFLNSLHQLKTFRSIGSDIGKTLPLDSAILMSIFCSICIVFRQNIIFYCFAWSSYLVHLAKCVCYPESVKRMAFLTQDYESLRFYVSMEISGALSSTNAMTPNSKLDALMAWASSLGLRNPRQKTFRTMIGIFLTLGDQHETDVLEKHRWFTQLKTSWKRICPLYPTCSNVSILPNSPENLAMEYPSVWKEYEDNHTLMPSSQTVLARLAAVERTICMRNTNSLLSPTLACSAANMFVCQGNSSAGNPSVGNPTLNHLLQLLQGMQDPRNHCNIEYMSKKVPEQPKPLALETATTSQQDLSEEPKRLADLPQRIAAPIVAAMEELPQKIPAPNVAFESTNENDKMEDTKELETKDKAMSSADRLMTQKLCATRWMSSMLA